MSCLVTDCPRCSAKKITFDVRGSTIIGRAGHGYKAEVYCSCRSCGLSSIFVQIQAHHDYTSYFEHGLETYETDLSDFSRTDGYVSSLNMDIKNAPESLPDPIQRAFIEGATCSAVGCHNAAGCMFRLCIDLATKGLLPPESDESIRPRERRSLGLRLEWLFSNGHIPGSLKELASCIKDDGNDGAHDGTLSKDEATDLEDFTALLLERIYTSPAKVENAMERRKKRRAIE